MKQRGKNNWSPIPVIMPVVCFTVDNLPNVNKQTNTNNIVSKVQILGYCKKTKMCT